MRAALIGASIPLLAAVPAAGAAVPSPLAPPQIVSSFRATLTAGNATGSLVWRTPESFADRHVTSAPFVGPLVEHLGTRTIGRSAGSPGVIERRLFAAQPDGYSYSMPLAQPAEFALARARGGKLRLAGGRVDGRPAWRGRYFLHANKCGALPSGTMEVWLDRRTLLPLRTIEKRGRGRSETRLRYSSAPVPASAFRPPPLGQRPQRIDYGFVRTSPAQAARRLPYAPRLPSQLPAGFRLAVAGWAARSGITGPEGSNPPSRSLFGAVYRRGFERIDVTQRLAGGRGWLNDPFGVECGFQFEQGATVSGVPARFGIGETIVSHLYWRDGSLLHTVSGPFPKATLVAIAESLAPVR